MNKITKADLVKFGNLELLAKQVVEGFITGLHKSPFHGFSVEFAEHRLYNSGESTKHIDWKLYGKTDKLFTKKYDEETNLRCQLVIDCSTSMYFGKPNELTKLEFALLSAASFIELLKKQRDAIGISLYTNTLELNTPAKSSLAHQHYLLQELEKRMHAFTPNSMHTTNTTSCIHTIAELTHKRSLILLFTDLLDGDQKENEFIEALQHLRHNKHEVIVFHILEKSSELELELGNSPLKIIDMETGAVMKLHPSEIQKNFKAQSEKYFNQLKVKCGQINIDFVEIDISQGIEFVLQQYLIKRQKMKL
jgi:uncharacterized protein (DUF58 family)